MAFSITNVLLQLIKVTVLFVLYSLRGFCIVKILNINSLSKIILILNFNGLIKINSIWNCLEIAAFTFDIYKIVTHKISIIIWTFRIVIWLKCALLHCLFLEYIS